MDKSRATGERRSPSLLGWVPMERPRQVKIRGAWEWSGSSGVNKGFKGFSVHKPSQWGGGALEKEHL